AGVQGGVAARLDRQDEVAGAGQRRDPRVDVDDPRPVLTGLPDVTGGDRSAFGDVRATDPNDLGQRDVAHRIAGPVDAKRLLVAGPGGDHAQPAVVVNVPGLQALRRDLPQGVALRGGHARPAEDGKRVRAVLRLDALDLRRHAPDGVVVRHGPKPLRRRLVAEVRAGQAVVVGALQVAA